MELERLQYKVEDQEQQLHKMFVAITRMEDQLSTLYRIVDKLVDKFNK